MWMVGVRWEVKTSAFLIMTMKFEIAIVAFLAQSGKTCPTCRGVGAALYHNTYIVQYMYLYFAHY